MKKGVLQRLLTVILLVGLVVAVPVAADGLFSDVWGWVRSLFVSSPTGAQAVDPDGDGIDSSADNCDDVYNPGQENIDDDSAGDVCDSLYAFSPSTVAQGAAVTVNLTGDFSSDATFGISGGDAFIQSQGVAGDSSIVGVLSVPLNASLGSFDVYVTQPDADVLLDAFEVVPGPFDESSIEVVSTSPFIINISTAAGVEKSSVSITSASLSLFNNGTNETFVLNMSGVVDPEGTFTITFSPFSIPNGEYIPTLTITVASAGLTVQAASTVSFSLAPVVFGPLLFCGDGILDIGEQCDDGNIINGDGCSHLCFLEFCGNGIIDIGEQCDDGNGIAGDGCSPACFLEFCGNGIIDIGEECDDAFIAFPCGPPCSAGEFCGWDCRGHQPGVMPVFNGAGMLPAGILFATPGGLVCGAGAVLTYHAACTGSGGAAAPGIIPACATASTTCPSPAPVYTCPPGFLGPFTNTVGFFIPPPPPFTIFPPPGFAFGSYRAALWCEEAPPEPTPGPSGGGGGGGGNVRRHYCEYLCGKGWVIRTVDQKGNVIANDPLPADADAEACLKQIGVVGADDQVRGFGTEQDYGYTFLNDDRESLIGLPEPDPYFENVQKTIASRFGWSGLPYENKCGPTVEKPAPAEHWEVRTEESVTPFGEAVSFEILHKDTGEDKPTPTFNVILTDQYGNILNFQLGIPVVQPSKFTITLPIQHDAVTVTILLTHTPDDRVQEWTTTISGHGSCTAVCRPSKGGWMTIIWSPESGCPQPQNVECGRPDRGEAVGLSPAQYQKFQDECCMRVGPCIPDCVPSKGGWMNVFWIPPENCGEKEPFNLECGRPERAQEMGLTEGEYSELQEKCCFKQPECEDVCPEKWECETIAVGGGQIEDGPVGPAPGISAPKQFGVLKHWPFAVRCVGEVFEPCPSHNHPCADAAKLSPGIVGTDAWNQCCGCGDGFVGPGEDCEPPNTVSKGGTPPDEFAFGKCDENCQFIYCTYRECTDDADCAANIGSAAPRCEDGHCVTDCLLTVNAGGVAPGQSPFSRMACTIAEPVLDPPCPENCWPEPCHCVEFLINFMGACTETNIFTDIMHLITIDAMGGGFQQKDFTFTNTQFPGAMGIMQSLCCPGPDCGDGKIQAPEQCDGGPLCGPGCRWAVPPLCGNNALDEGEECDWSVHGSALCDEYCRLRERPVCGNNKVEPGEQCDPPDGMLCDDYCQNLVQCDVVNDPNCAKCIQDKARAGSALSAKDKCEIVNNCRKSGPKQPCCSGKSCCEGPRCGTPPVCPDCIKIDTPPEMPAPVTPPAIPAIPAVPAVPAVPPYPIIHCDNGCTAGNYEPVLLSEEQVAAVRKVTNKPVISATRIADCCGSGIRFGKYVLDTNGYPEAVLLRGGKAQKITSGFSKNVICGGKDVEDYIKDSPQLVSELQVKVRPILGRASLTAPLRVETNLPLPIEIYFEKEVPVAVDLPAGAIEVPSSDLIVTIAFDVTIDRTRETYDGGKMFIRVPIPPGTAFPMLEIQAGRLWIDVVGEVSEDGRTILGVLTSEQVKEYFASGSLKARFALFKPPVVPDEVNKLTLAYDGGGSDAIVFVQGATTNSVSRRRFAELARLTHSENKLYFFLTDPGEMHDVNVRALAEGGSSKLLEDGIKNVHVVGYSYGGLVARGALEKAKNEGLALANLVTTVVYMGTPFGGTKVLEVWSSYLGFLEGAAGLIGFDRSVFEVLLTGDNEKTPSLPNARYGLIIGTREMSATKRLFEADEFPNDGVLIADPDAYPWWWVKKKCSPNELRVPLQHNELPGAGPVIDFAYAMVNAGLHSRNPSMPLLGYGQGVDVYSETCSDGDIVVLVSDTLPEQAVPHACSCGDEVCGLDENYFRCPRDCASFFYRFNFCLYIPWITNVLLLVLLIVSGIYIYQKEKSHKRGAGFKILGAVLVVAVAMIIAHFVKCQYLVPFAILLAILIAIMLFVTDWHFRKKGPKGYNHQGIRWH